MDVINCRNIGQQWMLGIYHIANKMMENFSRTTLLIVAGALSVEDGAATAFLLSYTRALMSVGLGLH